MFCSVLKISLHMINLFKMLIVLPELIKLPYVSFCFVLLGFEYFSISLDRMLRVGGDMFTDWAVNNSGSMRLLHASPMVLPATWTWRCVWAVLRQPSKVSLLMLLG